MGSDVWAHGGEYVSAGASTSDARFKLKTPTSGDYALYAWWPVRKGNSRAARFGVDTAMGTKWIEVNQARDGGMWVKLGTFEMKAGDRYIVRISQGAGSGEVIADAVALVRGCCLTAAQRPCAGRRQRGFRQERLRRLEHQY